MVVLSAECVRSPPTLVCSVSRLRFLALAFRLFLSGNCFVCGDWSTFPECFWALSSGRTTARAATKFHEKDLSHTQLRVSAPLNSPLRSQVARSALRRLSLPVFSPFPLLALLLSLVLLCVVFFTRSPLPTPARLRFCACVLLRAVSCRCRVWQWMEILGRSTFTMK